MRAKRQVNDSIRHRLRRIRRCKGLPLGEAAIRAGIPLSSYSCLESGHYAISLHNLARMLGALEVDINQVWPIETAQFERHHEGRSRQIQILRLQEVLSLSGASGIALFAIHKDCCKVLLQQALSDSELDSLVHFLQQGHHSPQGLWFRTDQDLTQFHLFLRAKECPSYVKQLIKHYMSIWRQTFLKEGKDNFTDTPVQ